jgi:hypothetical protein
LPPEAESWLLAKLQSISFDLDALIIGNGRTVTIVDKVVEILHVVSVICTEYIVVEMGEARGFFIEELVRELDGCQL